VLRRARAARGSAPDLAHGPLAVQQLGGVKHCAARTARRRQSGAGHALHRARGFGRPAGSRRARAARTCGWTPAARSAHTRDGATGRSRSGRAERVASGAAEISASLRPPTETFDILPKRKVSSLWRAT
jgi:hypothetical protein